MYLSGVIGISGDGTDKLKGRNERIPIKLFQATALPHSPNALILISRK